jgi:hypothetical protein
MVEFLGGFIACLVTILLVSVTVHYLEVNKWE